MSDISLAAWLAVAVRFWNRICFALSKLEASAAGLLGMVTRWLCVLGLVFFLRGQNVGLGRVEEGLEDTVEDNPWVRPKGGTSIGTCLHPLRVPGLGHSTAGPACLLPAGTILLLPALQALWPAGLPGHALCTAHDAPASGLVLPWGMWGHCRACCWLLCGFTSVVLAIRHFTCPYFRSFPRNFDASSRFSFCILKPRLHVSCVHGSCFRVPGRQAQRRARELPRHHR